MSPSPGRCRVRILGMGRCSRFRSTGFTFSAAGADTTRTETMPKTTKQLLSDQKCARAMLANVRWAEQLGWGAFGKALAVFLGATPWVGPGAAEFAQAVARYERAE